MPDERGCYDTCGAVWTLGSLDDHDRKEAHPMSRSLRQGWRLPRRSLLARVITGSVAAASARHHSARAGEGASVISSLRQPAGTPPAATGRLLARPTTPAEFVSSGLHRLGLDPERDAILYVPEGYRPEEPAPFVLSLHGAGGNAAAGLYPLGELADEYGCIVLAPASRGQTWDIILGGFGPDVPFLDQALTAAFARCAVDPERLAVAGFSDGASYALTLGVTNGDLFRRIIAFSPGFIAPVELHGDPRVFIAHGTEDEVLPIDLTSRPLARLFTRAGYDVTYLEFDGGHTVPPPVAREAMSWFLPPPGQDDVDANPAAMPPS
jgi:predicted esterase